MARTIDEKVVEMRFDNQNFESNVAQSMSTLDRLKNALNFSGVEKVFSGISSAADKVNFSGLSDALDGVSDKFSAFERIAIGALENVGSRISNYLVDQLKGVTIDQVTEGLSKYETKTKAVQTIMAATGMEIEEVSEQLDRLNWYTDETSYSFKDMVDNIGKFTSNGVALDKAVTAMEGISNLAAVSGQGKAEAARAMYNMSQALSSGVVMVRDWMSIENANMATKEFKEMVIQAAVAQGTLREFYDDVTGEKFYATWAEGAEGIIAQTEVNFKNMRETLKEKWFDDKVLIDVLNMYGGFSDKLSAAYDEINSLEGIDVTTSQIIKMTNQWIDQSLDLDEATAMTGKSAEELIAILSELGKEEYSLGRKAFAAAQEAKSFTEAIDATKDAVSTNIMNVFEQLFGNYEEAKVLWTDLANELWEIFAGPVSDLNDMLHAWNHIEMPDGTILKGREVFIQSIKDIYHAIRSVVDPITEAWEKIFPSMDFRQLFDLTTRFQEFTSTLVLSEEASETLRISFVKVFEAIKYVTGGVQTLIKAFTNSFFGENDGGFFKGVLIAIEEIGNTISSVVHAFSSVSTAYSKAMDGGDDAAKRVIESYKKAHPVVHNLVTIFYKLRDSLAVVGEYLGKLLSLNNIFVYYMEAGEGLAGVVNAIVFSFRDVLTAVKDLIKIWTGIDLSEPFEKVWTMILKFERTIEDLQADGKFEDFLSNIKSSLGELKDKFLELFSSFEGRFGSVISWFKPLGEAFKNIWKDLFAGLSMFSNGDQEKSIGGFFSAISKGLDAANEFIKNSVGLEAVINSIKSIIQDISKFLEKFLSLKDTIQIFKDAGGGMSGVIAILTDKLRNIYDLIADIIQDVSGFDIRSLEGKVVPVINKIVDVMKDAIKYVKMFVGLIVYAFNDAVKTFNDAGGGISGIAAVIKKALQDIFNLIADGIQKLTGFDIRSLADKLVPVFNKIAEVVQNVIKHIKDFVGLLSSSIGNISQIFNDAGGGLPGVLAVIKAALKGIFDLIADGIQKLTGFDIRSLADKVVLVFNKIIEVVKKAAGHIKDFIGMFKADKTKDIDEFGNTVETKLTPLQTFFEGLKKFFSGLAQAFSKFKPVFDAIFEKVGQVLGVIGESLGKAFENADFGTVIEWISKGLGVAIKFGVAKAVLSVSGTLKDISELFDGFTDILGGWQEKFDPGILLKIAAAIGVITVSLIALSGVDAAALGTSLGIVTAALGELVLAMAAGSKMSGSGDTKKSTDMATQMLIISAALLVASTALKKIAKLEWNQIQDGLAGMTIALGEMVAATILINRFGSNATKTASLISMATAMVIVSVALKSIGKMEWEQIKDGLAGMGLALAEMTLSIIAIDKFGSSHGNAGTDMLTMAAAVAAIAIILKKIADMGWDTISTGLKGMGLALAEVTAAMILLNQFGGNGVLTAVGFAAMAAALLLLSVPIGIFANMSLEEMGKSLLVMAGAFIVIGGLGGLFGSLSLEIIGFAVSVAAMGAALLLLVPSLEILGNMSLGEIVTGLLAMAGVFAVIGVAGLLLGPISPMILALSVAVALLGVAVLGIGAGLTMFATGLSILAETGSEGIDILIEAITRIVEVIPLLITKVGEGIVSAIKVILGILPTLFKEVASSIGEFLLTIINFISEHKFSFADAFVEIVSAILDVAEALIPKLAKTVVTIFDEILKVLAEHSGSIIDSVSTIVVNVLNGIADHLPEFIEAGINLVLSLIEGLGQGIVDNAERAKEAFTGLFEGILEAILIFLGIDRGEAEKFIEIAGDMIGGLVSGITEFAMDAFTAIGQFMVDLVDKVKEKLPEFIDRGKEIIDNIIEGVTSKIEDAVEAIKSAIDSIIEGATAVVDKAKDIGKSIVNKIKGGTEDPESKTALQDTGKNLVDGVKQGLENATSTVVKAGKKVVDTIVGAMQKAGDINSPSKRTKKEVGEFLGLGVGEGVFDSIPDVIEKISLFMDKIVDGMTTDEIAAMAKEAGLDLGGYFGVGLEESVNNTSFDFSEYKNAIKTDELGKLLADKGVEGALSETDYAEKAGDVLAAAGVDGALTNVDDAEDAGYLIGIAGAEGVLSSYTDCVDAGDICGSGVVDGLASYGAGGSNVRYTKDAATSVVTVVSDSITDGTDDIRDSAIVMAEAWQDGFINGAEWDSFTDEVKAKLGDALEGLVGYTLSDDNVISRVTKAGEVVKVEDGPGVITFNGSEGTIRVNASNSVAGLNGSKVSSIYSDMATEAQASMERARQYSSNGGSSNSNDSLTNAVNGLRSDMATYNANVTNLQVVMDTGTLVGEVTPGVNRSLGKQSELSQRGVYKFG